MDIDEILDKVYALPASSKDKLQSEAREVNYKKGQLLMDTHRVEPYIYFLKSGLVRAYADTPHGDVTFWFGTEGDAILSMKSYVLGERSYEHIDLLEDCELYQINIARLKLLYTQDVHLANWGRKFAEQELIKTEERLIAMQFKTAQQRYHELLQTRPELLRRVQLGYIASFLGMSQVSLSRIRSG